MVTSQMRKPNSLSIRVPMSNLKSLDKPTVPSVLNIVKCKNVLSGGGLV